MKISIANELFTTSGNATTTAMPIASQSSLLVFIALSRRQGRSA